MLWIAFPAWRCLVAGGCSRRFYSLKPFPSKSRQPSPEQVGRVWFGISREIERRKPNASLGKSRVTTFFECGELLRTVETAFMWPWVVALVGRFSVNLRGLSTSWVCVEAQPGRALSVSLQSPSGTWTRLAPVVECLECEPASRVAPVPRVLFSTRNSWPQVGPPLAKTPGWWARITQTRALPSDASPLFSSFAPIKDALVIGLR